MKRNDGFSLPEVIIAMSIVMMLVATALPIHQLVITEQHAMKQHQLIKLALHDKLQHVIWTNEPLNPIEQKIDSRTVQMTFMMEGVYIKGCAEWENVRNKTEKVCLYGIQEK